MIPHPFFFLLLPICRYTVAEGQWGCLTQSDRYTKYSTSLSDGTPYHAVYFYLSVYFALNISECRTRNFSYPWEALSISAYTLLYSYCSFHLFLQCGAKEDQVAFTPPSRPLRPSRWKLHDPRGGRYSLRGAVIENLNAEIATLKGHVT
ncbi:hypothetical protein F5888DRAFT_1689990 [Russula emetica]|nr:hypothetical protein F5888DRAFT_1689990 [Russula emetica]